MIKLNATKAAKKNIRDVSTAELFFLGGLRDALFDIGRLTSLEASTMIDNNGRTGRIYIVGGKVHQASAPGEAPANLSGKLKSGMDYNVHGHEEVEWGSTVDYGRFLEEGTRSMAPRPYLLKVHAKHGADASVYLGRRVDDALKRRR